jgi:predicted DNA-binding helix-hairpin-helix protein
LYSKLYILSRPNLALDTSPFLWVEWFRGKFRFRNMDLYEKISILGPSAQYDTCGPKDFGTTTDIPGVYHAQVGGNRVCRLFKVLQSNVCRNNCRYCAFRKDRDCQRTTASPEEMARAFTSAYSRRLVEGLFLSSGVINNPETTMTKMLDTATILRNRYQYHGYLHLKIMPGSSLNCIQESLKLANRVSLNIESPTEEGLTSLSPDKDFRRGFFYTLTLIKNQVRKLRFAGKRTPSLTTQFVVGAGQESDKEIIDKTHLLYKNFGLKRVFYSAFRPVVQTPLADKPPTSATREHRLYQADFLMRFYRFRPWDIPLTDGGFLPEMTDPKTLWAQQHPHYYPVNLNQANYWQLLKIPGLGPTTAKKILKIRQTEKIKSLARFEHLRIQTKKMAPYINF